MSRLLKRMFSDNPFRKDTPGSYDDIQRSRRVLVRSSTGALSDQATRSTTIFGSQIHADEHIALKDAVSLANSDLHTAEQPTIASQQQPFFQRKATRTRRRLSKRNRKLA